MENIRIIPQKKTGLVLSGGGSKGAYEFGVMKALNELGWTGQITGVSGSSIGAFNTALFAQKNLDAGEYIWRNLTAADFINVNADKIREKFAQAEGVTPKEALLQNIMIVDTGQKAKELIGNKLSSVIDAKVSEKLYGETLSANAGKTDSAMHYAVWFAQNLFGDGFATPEKLLDILKEYVNFETILNSDLDLFSTVCRWNPDTEFSGTAQYISWKGKEKEAILQLIASSMALPVLYPHNEKDNEYYVDGGYADNIPIKPLYDAGYRNMIVIYLDKFVGKGRKRRIALEETLFPEANFIRIFPNKKFDYSFARSCTVSAKKTAIHIQMGYDDTFQLFHDVIN